jgi:hypothetical protein
MAETYLVKVTIKDCEKKDRRLAANKRTHLIEAKVTEKTVTTLNDLMDKHDGSYPDIIERAVAYYAGLVKEGVRV